MSSSPTETSGGGSGVWLLWLLELVDPAVILLRPKRRRRTAEGT